MKYFTTSEVSANVFGDKSAGNKKGNQSTAKPESQIVAEAIPLQGGNLFRVARQLNVGRARFAKIVAKYGLNFRVGIKTLSEVEILQAIKDYGPFESENTLAAMLGTSHQKVAAVAKKHGIQLYSFRASPDRTGFIYDERGYAYKRCSCCGEYKGAEMFNSHEARVLTGLTSWCRDCERDSRALKSALKRLPV